MPRTALLASLLVGLLLFAAPAFAAAQPKGSEGPGRSATPIGLAAVALLVAMASAGIVRGRSAKP